MLRDFLGGPVVKTVLPMQGDKGLIPARGLGSHMPSDMPPPPEKRKEMLDNIIMC